MRDLMSLDLSDNLRVKLDQVESQFESINEQLVDPEVVRDHARVRSLSIKRAALEPLAAAYRAYRSALAQAADLRHIIDANEDPELVALARDELVEVEQFAASTLGEIKRDLVMSDEMSFGSVILEIRAGVGGDEAAIWAGDLAEMYRRYAAARRWDVEILQASPSERGGFKSAILRIEGDRAWAELAYEGGTHQVKRIPETETQGRVHTSTATVAVLPEAEELEVDLDPADVKEMVTTAQGPGGQNVNKVATAVHLIHQPTGIEVRMQETKSQAQNREKAWRLLRARLFERQKAEQDAARSATRNQMIGTASRSEKIRTYRYKENLVVDHRLGDSFNLSSIMAGELRALVTRLIEVDAANRLAAL